MIPHLGDSGRRDGLAVQVVRDLLDRHDPIGLEEENREDGALLRPPEPDRFAVVGRLDRAKDAEIDGHCVTVAPWEQNGNVPGSQVPSVGQCSP